MQRGRCSTWNTFIEVRGSPATIDYFGRRLVLITLGAASFCAASAALGAPPARFAWQAQHLQHLRLVLRGKCSTGSISVAYCGACLSRSNHLHNTINTTPATQHHQHNTISTSSSTQHHQHNTIYASPSTRHHLHSIINTTPSPHHHLHSIIITAPSPQHHLTSHHLHNIVYTTSSTQHHLHNTIYTTSSTQHHLHYIITYWQVQHLEHCHLTPSASFLLIPLLLFFVVVSSLFCFR